MTGATCNLLHHLRAGHERRTVDELLARSTAMEVERRLNVAVTRARHELRVFSSCTASRWTSRTKGHRRARPQALPEFAERGARAPVTPRQPGRQPLPKPRSPLRWAARLAGATQIGASSFRIDLGVVHPDLARRYLAGIECDGAHTTAPRPRDRDKLREQVLRGSGLEIEHLVDRLVGGSRWHAGACTARLE